MDDLLIILILVLVVPVFVLFITAIIQMSRKQFKSNKALKNNLEFGETDIEQQKMFKDAYGGKENIKEVTLTQNRITVTVVDVDKVDLAELQILGATGVLITQNTIKCSYQERAPFIYKLLQ